MRTAYLCAQCLNVCIDDDSFLVRPAVMWAVFIFYVIAQSAH